jgi:tRNA-specific 2-thiouridylase
VDFFAKKVYTMQDMKKKISRKTVAHVASKPTKGKVLMALSGGIDSAVSAYLLLEQGYEVEAAFMKNWSSTQGLLKNECPWLVDRQDALRVAAFLKIPLHTLDFEQQYADTVMKYFFDEYQAGRTPNPDVMCNKEIKFKLLYQWAMDHGFDYLATGHYAQVGKRRKKKVESKDKAFHLSPFTFHLTRSADEFKDQTYFIYNIKTEQLPHLLFPIGGMKKASVKKLAAKIGLPNKDKKESMGLCFVGKIRLKDFLEQKLKPRTGSIVDQDGVVVGEHQGLYNFTLGQRQGIHVGGSGPYYVFKKDLRSNTLFVTNNAQDKRLETISLQLHSVNWIEKSMSRAEYEDVSKSKVSKVRQKKLFGRYRHQGALIPLTVKQVEPGLCEVIFSRPQKAVTSGQSLVIYEGNVCVGGGVIV